MAEIHYRKIYIRNIIFALVGMFLHIQTISSDTVFSEYFYGKCATRYKTLILHDHLTYNDIKGKLIIRGYLDTPKNITCVYVRSESTVPEMVKYKPTRFTMCLSKIRYQYTATQKFIHFYEWFLPSFMRPGIDWDIFFFY